MSELTHFSPDGASRMVDVGGKPISRRTARAEGFVLMQAETLRIIENRGFAKGNVLEVARLAGIMATKRTADLIPLCHVLPLERVEVEFSFPGQNGVRVEVLVSTEAKTGVEMEALAAVSVTCLTIYDMCKSVDRSMEISRIRLLEKTGGRSGQFLRETESPLGLKT
jgi:cyclic pyranopterin phosphate synthase